MRPAKDLKDMVAKARGGGGYLEDPYSAEETSQLDTSHTSAKHLNN